MVIIWEDLFMKKRFKMYKSGKLWCYAAIAFAALTFGTTSVVDQVHADTNTQPTITRIQQSRSTQIEDQNHDHKMLAANNASQSNDDSTQHSVTNVVQVDNNTQNNDQRANTGHLDGYQIHENVQTGRTTLNASGWQIDGQSNTQRYRYAIAYDNTTHQELDRERVTPVTRNDVRNAYPNVVNSNNSGFNVTLKLPGNLSGHSISIISRYSSDAINGEGDHIDYWFAPIVFDNQNRGHLDSISLDKNGDLVVSGWHASNQATGKKYHYIIAFDQTTGREIARQEVTPQGRDDVAKAYPTIENADESGFKATFKLTPEYVNDNIQFVSRWTDDAAGNGNATDYWFNILDKTNVASLDDLSSDQKGNLHISGWNATNQALGKKYHYIIIYDQTRNHEITRKLVDQVLRKDVALAYPTIVNAGISGFDTTFKLTSEYAEDNIQILSRWTSDPDGNNDATDYWFTLVQKNNRGNLDRWDLSNGTLQVNGWHSDDASIYEPYHYLIVFDNTTGQQIAMKKVDMTSSDDVAKAFTDTRFANKARFSAIFKDLNLIPDHQYSLVSCYSISNTGNGDDGNSADRVDYWYGTQNLNQHGFSIDSFKANGHQITVTGWMANDEAINKPDAFIIMLADGKEVARQQVKLSSRLDVANVFPSIYDSAKSGFVTQFNLPDNVNGNIQFVLRFSNQTNGEGSHSDMWTGNYTANAGSFDSIYSNNANSLYVAGWHAAESELNKPYSFLFVMDGQTGRELARFNIASHVNRYDVQNAYPWIANSAESGFNVDISADALRGHEIRLMHRYTDDQSGNGNFIDYYDGQLYYINPNGYLATNEFVTLFDPNDTYPDGRPHSAYSVFFDGSGRKVYGWHNVNGSWYNFSGADGKFLGFSQRVLDWFRGRRHHLTYSMYGSRNGGDGTGDCSGSMTQALRDAGAYPYGALYSTESLHGYLRGNGYYLAGAGRGRMQVQYGDIIIWGLIGYSTGGAGHTLAISTFGSGDDINCISTCGYNHHQRGEAIEEYNYYRYWASDGYPYQYIYRPYNLNRA